MQELKNQKAATKIQELEKAKQNLELELHFNKKRLEVETLATKQVFKNKQTKQTRSFLGDKPRLLNKSLHHMKCLVFGQKGGMTQWLGGVFFRIFFFCVGITQITRLLIFRVCYCIHFGDKLVLTLLFLMSREPFLLVRQKVRLWQCGGNVFWLVFIYLTSATNSVSFF